jgi:hypothetical protein
MVQNCDVGSLSFPIISELVKFPGEFDLLSVLLYNKSFK